MPLFCKDKSKVKLVIFFSNGGAAVFYSIVKENKKTYEVLTEKMTNRILKKKYDFQFTRAIFYENQNGFKRKNGFKMVLGSQHQNTTKTPDYFDPENSIVKATMIGMDHKPKVFYSRLNEEQQLGFDPLEIQKAMQQRLNSKFEYKSLTFEFR